MSGKNGKNKTRLPSGRWYVRWRDHTGKRRSTTFKTEKQADAHLARVATDRDDIRAGRKIAPTEKLDRAPLLDDYLDRVFVPGLEEPGAYKESEKHSTRSVLKNHIRPALGSRRLDEIDRAAGAAFRGQLAKKDLSPKTVHNIMLLLTRILRDAEDREIINKAPTFKPGKTARRQRRESQQPIAREEYLDFEEFDQLVAACRADREILALVLVAGRAGLRSGELRGLRWADIDLKARTITVREAEYRGVFDSPKSGVSRTVAMSTSVRDALQAMDPGVPSSRVFRGSEKAMTLRLIAAGRAARLDLAEQQYARMRECRRVAKLKKRGGELTAEQKARIEAYKAGTPARFGWHILRHTFCSHLAMNGTPLIMIKEWAGHANVQTTQRYMHLAPAARGSFAAIDALDATAKTADVIPLRRS